MQHFAARAVSVFFLALLALPAGAGHPFRPAMSIAEQYLFSAANGERAQRGLQPLRWDEPLSFAANEHAREMAARANISHQYPGEADLAARGRLAGAHFSAIAENVAEAPSAVTIHDAWMQSEGHRANLLDPRVDSVGIAVQRRDGQLYAVEDFDRSVAMLSFQEQERAVESLLERTAAVDVLPSTDEARRTCSMETGFAGLERPGFVMRFTAGELDRLPAALRDRLRTGKYRAAVVGACTPDEGEPFTAFKVAVLLFR